MVQQQESTRAADAGEEDVISTLVFHVGRELRTALDRRFESHGITSQQAALLMLSRLLKEPSPIKMAARLGTDAAGMTRLLDRLERKQLIVRKVGAGDRRLVVVELGPRSKHMVRRLVPEFQSAETGLLDGFHPREVKQLRSMLVRLLGNARRLSKQ